MNTDSIKSDIQQVLDHDIQLRKEFNALKRSLSDYRNQLIMRDEDCKRLQVTIDVLNTKLVVMERDNNSYKTELNSFRELRGTIKEQLEEKQSEIERRLEEIQGLRDDLHTMASGYEERIATLTAESSQELERVKQTLGAQIEELRTTSQYREKGMREEHENLLSTLNSSWADKEQELQLMHEDVVSALKASHEEEINSLKSEFNNVISNLTASSEQEISELRSAFEKNTSEREQQLLEKLNSVENVYQTEIANLRQAIEEQRNTYTTNLYERAEALQLEYAAAEQKIRDEHQAQIENLTREHSELLNTTVSGYELKITQLIGEYEDKLSNTLIHSNSQNSKLNDELGKAREENNTLHSKAAELNADLNLKSVELADLAIRLSATEEKLNAELLKYETLGSEFVQYKNQASLNDSDLVCELQQQVTEINRTHSEYVDELGTRIEDLNTELKNLGLLFESNTNLLSETEAQLEASKQELQLALLNVEELNVQLLEATSSNREEELENYKIELLETTGAELKAKNLEFEKLLAENTNLIDEIDSAQDKVEAMEQELFLLRGELEEVRMQSQGKSEYFKETLANKNFEITNLEANNAALLREVEFLKKEVLETTAELKALSETAHLTSALQQEKDQSLAKVHEMQAEIDTLYTIITNLNDKVAGYEQQIGDLEAKLNEMGAVSNAEREAFIDRLFKQIDELNDQRMALLDEKDQMASQLLKMNEVVGTISQQIDSEQIDTTTLNNHRRNVILATDSKGEDNSPMKEQINDLVREIDKCIALLSA